jgi:hypothetical protein
MRRVAHAFDQQVVFVRALQSAIRLAVVTMVGLVSVLGAGGSLSVAEADCPAPGLCPHAGPQILTMTAKRNGSSVSVQITWKWPNPVKYVSGPLYTQPDSFSVEYASGQQLARIPGNRSFFETDFMSDAKRLTRIGYNVCAVYNATPSTGQLGDKLCDYGEVQVPPVPSGGPGAIHGTFSWKDSPSLGPPGSTCRAFTISRAGPENVEGFGEWYFSAPTDSAFNPVLKEGRWVCGYSIVRLPLRVPLRVAVQPSPGFHAWTIADPSGTRRLVIPVASPAGWSGLVTLVPLPPPASPGGPRFGPSFSGGPCKPGAPVFTCVRQDPSGELEVFDINFDVTFQPLRCWLYGLSPQPAGTIHLSPCIRPTP